MKEDNVGVRTSLIVSNGARAEDQAQQTTATRLRLALGSAIRQPGAVVSCNLAADAVHEFRKLCGYTNVQGRHVNGDADACRGSVEHGTGRFVHLEQDPNVLGAFAQGWARIDQQPFGAALIGAFTAVLPPASDQRLLRLRAESVVEPGEARKDVLLGALAEHLPPHLARNAVGVIDLPQIARLQGHARGPHMAGRGVLAERGFEIARPRMDELGQAEAVLDRHAGALRQ